MTDLYLIVICPADQHETRMQIPSLWLIIIIHKTILDSTLRLMNSSDQRERDDDSVAATGPVHNKQLAFAALIAKDTRVGHFEFSITRIVIAFPLPFFIN